jgi:polysaccharide biosynthesis/export protein
MRSVANVVIVLVLAASQVLAQAPAAQATSSLPQPANANPTPANPSPTNPSSAAATGAVEPVIGIGDLVKVSVMGAPDFDQEIRISGKGEVYLQLAGAVHIAGLTTEQADQAIRQRLMDGGYFSDPQVSVFDKEYATQGVSILGEVQRPGVYPVTGPRQLFDVLSMAGGTTVRAGQAVSITHRDQPGSTRTVTLSRDPAENIKANVDISPGDTIVVSKAGMVYVVGAVHQSTGVVLENTSGITVLQAIATAGGTNPTAALNNAKIIRNSGNGPSEIPIKLKSILAAKAPDVRLQAEDILFVPNSPRKMAGSMALESAVRLATTVAAYAVFY